VTVCQSRAGCHGKGLAERTLDHKDWKIDLASICILVRDQNIQGNKIYFSKLNRKCSGAMKESLFFHRVSPHGVALEDNIGGRYRSVLVIHEPKNNAARLLDRKVSISRQQH
jgi:hypothetical protein